MNDDEIRVGDRLELLEDYGEAKAGGVFEVVPPGAYTGARFRRLKWPGGETFADWDLSDCFGEKPLFKRLPRKEEKTALFMGAPVVIDPSLAPGQMYMISTGRAGKPGDYVFFPGDTSKSAIPAATMERLGRNLNDVQQAMAMEALAIEERRAVLKPGDRITDPALLCEGMRVRYVEGEHERIYTLTERVDTEGGGWETSPPALILDHRPYWGSGDITITFVAHLEAKALRRWVSNDAEHWAELSPGAGPEEFLYYLEAEDRPGAVPRLIKRAIKSEPPRCAVTVHKLNPDTHAAMAYDDPKCVRRASAVPKCAPGCTPKEPCRTEGVCPVFKEEAVARYFYPGRSVIDMPNEGDEVERMRAESRHGFSTSGFGGIVGGIWRRRP